MTHVVEGKQARPLSSNAKQQFRCQCGSPRRLGGPLPRCAAAPGAAASCVAVDTAIAAVHGTLLMINEQPVKCGDDISRVCAAVNACQYRMSGIEVL